LLKGYEVSAKSNKIHIGSTRLRSAVLVPGSLATEVVPRVRIIIATTVVPRIVLTTGPAGVILDGHRTGGRTSSVVPVVLGIVGPPVLPRRPVIVPPLIVVVLFGVLRRTLVLHVGVEPCLPVGVVRHDLGTTVGQLDPVLPPDLVSVARLLPVVVVSGVLVFDLVAELVRFWLKRLRLQQ
jgi:hypothetical protein